MTSPARTGPLTSPTPCSNSAVSARSLLWLATPDLRRLALPRSIRHWSLTTLREKLVKIGARIVKHSRYFIFQLAEVAVPAELFAAILGRIHGLVPMPTYCENLTYRHDGAS